VFCPSSETFLFGRDEEFEDLCQLLGRCQRGDAAAVVLSGAPGSGSSYLLESFIQQAITTGAAVVLADRIRCEILVSLPVGTTRVVVSWQELWPRLNELGQERTIVVCLTNPSDLFPTELVRLFRFTRPGLCRANGVLLMINDATEGALDTAYHAELLNQSNLHWLRLRPLAKDIALSVATRLYGGADPAVPEQVYELSGGSPLLLRALVDERRLCERFSPGSQWPAHDGLYATVAVACIRRCHPDAVTVGTGMAVLSRYSTPSRLSRLLGLSRSQVNEVLAALATAGLARDAVFRHTIVEQALLAQVDVAEVLGTSHVFALLQTAEEALDADEVELADKYLELAYGATKDPAQRAQVSLRRALVLWRTDPSLVEREHIDRWLAELDPGSPRIDEHELDLLVRLLAAHGRFEQAGQLASQLPETGFTRSRSWFCYPARGLSERWYAGIYTGCAAEECCDGESAERLLRSSPLTDTTLPLILHELDGLVQSGLIELAVQWCGRFLRESTSRGIRGWQAVFAGLRGEFALNQGLLPVAERFAQTSLDLTADRTGTVLHGSPMAVLIMVYTEMAQYKRAADLLYCEVPNAVFHSLYGLSYLRARGRYALAINRPRQALTDFLDMGRLIQRWGLDGHAQLPWRIDVAEACVQLNNLDKARRLLDSHDATADRGNPRLEGAVLRLRAALAPRRDQVRLLLRAAERWSIAGDKLQHARTQFELGVAYRKAGEHGRAVAILTEAARGAAECGANGLRERISRALAAEGHDPIAAQPGLWTGLSQSERRVAALAARGLTNPEIATKLFVTVSTVEQHLTKIYRKLDITSRQQLPVELQSEPAGTT